MGWCTSAAAGVRNCLGPAQCGLLCAPALRAVPCLAVPPACSSHAHHASGRWRDAAARRCRPAPTCTRDCSATLPAAASSNVHGRSCTCKNSSSLPAGDGAVAEDSWARRRTLQPGLTVVRPWCRQHATRLQPSASGTPPRQSSSRCVARPPSTRSPSRTCVYEDGQAGPAVALRLRAGVIFPPRVLVVPQVPAQRCGGRAGSLCSHSSHAMHVPAGSLPQRHMACS